MATSIPHRSRRILAEGVKIAAGTSTIEPGTRDRRFADEAWSDNGLYRRLGQSYLSWAGETKGMISELDLGPERQRAAELIGDLLTDAAAPTNQLLGNPAALREARHSGGRSLARGARNLIDDVVNNGGMPRVVDDEPFETGKTIAATPGAVVFRNPVLELIQYAPATAKVQQRPLLIVPPQINKYYIMDLAPGRSFVEHAVAAGHRVFAVSWRNPTVNEAHWDLDTYAEALIEATDALLEITGRPDLNVLGVCAGGMTAAATLGHLAAIGDDRVHSLTLLVTVIDWGRSTTMSSLIGSPAGKASLAKSQRDGILPAADLNSAFSWLRPKDLVWNYWVNNYLMGRKPAAFDLLAWNADSTNLPAGLHADFMDMAGANKLAKPGAVEVLGTPVDLGAITCPAYVVGASTDHITPWESCYETIDLLGGDDKRFVLSSQGHVQALVNPSGNPKGHYHTNDATPAACDEWLDEADEQAGSWWDHWTGWARGHGGRLVNARAELGSDAHPAAESAPGTYVLA